MAKKVLPKKFHKDFHRFNNEGDVKGLSNLIEENNIDINGMFFKPDENSEYNHYLFLETFTGEKIPEKLEYFLSKGVDLKLTGYNCNNALFSVHVHEKYFPVLEMLVKAGIEVDHKDNDGCTKLYHLVRNFGDKKEWDEEGNEREVRKEYFDLSLKFVRFLLENGADPAVKNNYDTSPMDWAVHRREEGLSDESDEELHSYFLRQD